MSAIETEAVAELVEDFASTTLSNAEKYANSEPLDESNIHTLHLLAARIYALGWTDGHSVACRTESRAYNRRRAADRPKATYTNTPAKGDSE